MPNEDQLKQAPIEAHSKGGFIDQMLNAKWQSVIEDVANTPVSIDGVPIKHDPALRAEVGIPISRDDEWTVYRFAAELWGRLEKLLPYGYVTIRRSDFLQGFEFVWRAKTKKGDLCQAQTLTNKTFIDNTIPLDRLADRIATEWRDRLEEYTS